MDPPKYQKNASKTLANFGRLGTRKIGKLNVKIISKKKSRKKKISNTMLWLLACDGLIDKRLYYGQNI